MPENTLEPKEGEREGAKGSTGGTQEGGGGRQERGQDAAPQPTRLSASASGYTFGSHGYGRLPVKRKTLAT